MAGEFLIVDDVIVPVEYPDGAEQDTPDEIGDTGRAFAGNILSSIRAWKRKWTFRTKWITRAQADTIIAKLKSVPSISCSGEVLGGAVECHPRILGEDITSTAEGRRFKVQFALEEV